MNLMRWTPWRECEEMTDPLNRFLARPETRRSNGKEVRPVAGWVVFVDISETGVEFHIKAEFTGLKNETVRVTLDRGCFHCKANRKRSGN